MNLTLSRTSSMFFLNAAPLLAALCLGAASARGQANLEVLTSRGYGVVPIKRPLPNVLLVTATINGRKMDVVLDTGFAGEGLALDSAWASRLGMKPETGSTNALSATGSKITIKKGSAASVTLGNAQINGVPVTFGIFQGIRYDASRRSFNADGFVGSGFLRTCSAVIDLHNQRLYLRPPGAGRGVALGPALRAIGLSEASFIQAGHNCLIDAEINGATGKMILDTGAGLSGVDKRFATQMKAMRFDSNIGFVDAAGVVERAEKTPVQSFKIGGVPSRQRDLLMTKYGFFADTGGKVIGLLGMDILGQDWAIIDFGQRKLYFAAGK